MPEPGVTVAVPVGPFPANRRWLAECLASVAAQTRTPDEVLLIDDMAGLTDDDISPLFPTFAFHVRYGRDDGFTYANRVVDGAYASCIRVWRAPWRLGVAHAFNFGVALARGDLVFLLGSDDTLNPLCIEKCVAEWKRSKARDAYYWTGVRYMDTGELQTVPCNAAMVTKGFWRRTGGFPVETAVGAPDAALVSILMVHDPQSLIPVANGAALYNYRRHDGTDTAGRGPWQGAILTARGILTDTWKRPEWGRLGPIPFPDSPYFALPPTARLGILGDPLRRMTENAEALRRAGNEIPEGEETT